MSLILFGHKGVGKTTVGAQLAQRLHWSHIDTDQALLSYYRACVGDAAGWHLHDEATKCKWSTRRKLQQ